MMNLLKNLSGFAVFALSLTMVWAQPTGEAMFNFDASTDPLWDLTGTYMLDTPVLGAGNTQVPLSYSVGINQDANGKLTGQGDALVTLGGNTVAASYTVRGSVTGGGNATRASFTVTLKGKDVLEGAVRSFSIKASYKLDIVSSGLTLAGSVSGSTSIQGAGGGKISDKNFELALPPGVDGAWFANLHFLPFNTLTGSGYVAVDSINSNADANQTGQRVMSMTLSGSYSAKNNLSKVSMKGVNESRGTSLNVSWYGQNKLKSMRGKALGQSLKFDAAP